MARYCNDKGEVAGTITHTDYMHVPGTRERFTRDLACMHCGQRGKITWEENDAGHRQDGSQRRLVDLSPGFHSETGRIRAGDQMIICSHCDDILFPDAPSQIMDSQL
jgi:hypothetical protein